MLMATFVIKAPDQEDDHCRRPGTLLKKRLCQRYFPVSFTKILRTPFLQNISWRLVLQKTHILHLISCIHALTMISMSWVFYYKHRV